MGDNILFTEAEQAEWDEMMRRSATPRTGVTTPNAAYRRRDIEHPDYRRFPSATGPNAGQYPDDPRGLGLSGIGERGIGLAKKGLSALVSPITAIGESYNIGTERARAAVKLKKAETRQLNATATVQHLTAAADIVNAIASIEDPAKRDLVRQQASEVVPPELRGLVEEMVKHEVYAKGAREEYLSDLYKFSPLATKLGIKYNHNPEEMFKDAKLTQQMFAEYDENKAISLIKPVKRVVNRIVKEFERLHPERFAAMKKSDEALSQDELDEIVSEMSDKDTDANDPDVRKEIDLVKRYKPESLGLKAGPEVAGRRKEQMQSDIRIAEHAATAEIDRPLASQAERDYSTLREAQVITEEQEHHLRLFDRISQSLGRKDVLTTVDVPVSEIVKVNENLQLYKSGFDITNRMIELIEEDPSRAGWAASIRNLVDSGVGRLEAIGQVLGPNVGRELSFSQAELAANIAAGEYEGSEKDANRFLKIVTDDSIGVMELLGTLSAYRLDRTLRPQGRFSIESVKVLARELNFKDPRKVGLAKLKTIRQLFSQQFNESTEAAQRLNEVVRGRAGKEGLFIGEPKGLDFPATEPGAGSSGAEYEIVYDDKGEAIGVRKIQR
jgi:hypothetical protein